MDEMEQAEDEFAQKAMIEAVENQIADGHPREAGMVMMALTKNGLDHDAALEKMADVLVVHVAATLENQTPFDINAYARDLLQLAKG
ncbi:hypothetical protein A3754_07150 [Alcanivorax sp. HI0083]|nr:MULTISPECIES: hypothetical protein [unclassified Alcanivorax]KZY32316.1 hypothetical protein A3730_04765 [Alcanivorax sp. HI0044]KZZ27610.1 hypothetical protein A3754_07150 [Alcanivorax sp. HI0083]